MTMLVWGYFKLLSSSSSRYPQQQSLYSHLHHACTGRPCDHSWCAVVQTDIKCTLKIEEVTKDTCRQTLEGFLDITVGMGLGQTAERIIVKQLTKVYKSIPIVVEK